MSNTNQPRDNESRNSPAAASSSLPSKEGRFSHHLIDDGLGFRLRRH